MSDPIDTALDLAPLPQANTSLTVIDKENQLTSADTDVEDARDNLQNAVGLSQTAVQDMLTIAQQSQHPKAYEVLNSLIKTYADVSMGMVDLQLKKQRLNGSSKGGSPDDVQTINNNLFVGSTAELQKMLDDMRNKGE
jgi:hypothetical protein